MNSDTFSFFNNETSKDEFRRYSKNKINQPPLIQYLLDENDLESNRFNNSINKVCDYTKIPYQTIDIKKWNSNPIIPSSTRVLCMSNSMPLNDASIEKITEFVASGGTFFLPIASQDKRIAFLLGFKPNADHYTDVTSKGFYFKTPVLPDFNASKINEEELHYGFAKENFSNTIKVAATAVNNPDYPVILENPIGKGRVVLFNFQKTFEKRDRGLLFSGILKGLEGIPYPIANTSTIFLDDFPCPLYDIKNEPIASEMNLSSKDFVQKIWWPDMLKIAQKFHISYSVLITFDYKNKIEPPFIFDQWDKNKIKSNKKIESLSNWFVHDAAKNGHELAFHGYNHNELMKKTWRNKEYIDISLKSVLKKWEVNNFGQLPISYVPPSNYIDEMGINELKKSMPSLKFLCSSFSGDLANGEGREFDFDPYNQNFFDYPRITYGYYLSNAQKYSQQSAYLYTGIWTHFIHPDDVYQLSTKKDGTHGDFDSRNSLNLGWYKTNGKNFGMFSEFNNYLKRMTSLFSQIRFLNAGEAAPIVLDWRASNFNFNTKDGIFSVEELHPEESISGKQYWFLYSSKQNSLVFEDSFNKQNIRFSKTPFQSGFLYTLFTNESKISLPDLNFSTDNQKNNEITKVKTDFKGYQEKVTEYQLFLKMEAIDSEVKLKIEIELLKRKMLSDAKIDPKIWNLYAKYMNWEEKGSTVWEILEVHCKAYPLPENIMYSKELNRSVEYPNEQIKEKWMSAQIEVTPNDVVLLREYIALFYSDENKDKIKCAMQKIVALTCDSDMLLLYLQHLLTFEPNEALKELNTISPTEKYKSIATDICWLYVDNNEFQKAYDWSLFASNIDFDSQFSWLVELKAYETLECEYYKYSSNHPENNTIKAKMSAVLYEIGKFKEAWVLANSLPDGILKENLRLILNKDVIYVEEHLQEDLMNNHSEFFYQEVLKLLREKNRKEFNQYLEVASSLESNKTKAAAFKNILSYNFHDTKKNIHSLAATFSSMYRVNVAVSDPDNVTQKLYGFQYGFKNTKNVNKLQYWTTARLEHSDLGKNFFQFEIGANRSKNKKFTSAEFKVFPAENGAAHSKNIYRLQGNVYQDATCWGIINTSALFETNYYTKSKKSATLSTEEAYGATLTGKAIVDNGEDKRSKFLPFLELSYLKSHVGNTELDLASGYPFWAISERFYAGGGLGWKFGKEDSNFNGRVEASWFYDDYSDQFKRFIGGVSYQIADYTAITAAFEIYSQTKFYSNVLQFGLKYNLKKRKK
jgi:hypothetical protein